MGSAIITAVFVLWLVAMWAMLMMVIAALKDREQRSLGWLLSGSFLLANYNRQHFRIFIISVLVAVGLVALTNVLLITGRSKL